jgi:thioredoxin reductase
MSLGRALRKVLVIDSGKPCNRQTPHSHNFLTRDGNTPAEIAAIGKKQVAQYSTLSFLDAIVTGGVKTREGFELTTAAGQVIQADRLIFASGIRDLMPDIPGFSECWGISVLHCPYCHGYEVRNEPTGLLGNGDWAYEFALLLLNWTPQLTLFTNGPAGFTPSQLELLQKKGVVMVETPVQQINHQKGQVEQIILSDGSLHAVKAIYARCAFEQHCQVPLQLDCELTEDGYIKVDATQKTSVDGVYACGDNTTRIRTVSNAVAQGTLAGMMLNREMILAEYL